ncbi:MAG TPA: D-2-hydroxyacid dehydrogenase [Candidatus Binatus sp.]|nr:D-2-hydroxyacid dehydrogenase [Candidatus Binatus sp.]
MKVVLNFHLGKDVRIAVPEGVLATLRARFPGVAFAPADDRESLAREAADADVFYGFTFPPELLSQSQHLRWIQSVSAGIEGNLSPGVVERGILVTNGAGIASTGIAEHVLAVMLGFCRNLHVAARLQREARWDRPAVMAGTGAPIREFHGSRVAILGLGPIGATVARDSAALGAIVRGMRRHPPPTASPAPYDAVLGPDGLDALLAWADFLVLAVPHTPETEKLIGARELRVMRPDSYVVNVARGSVIDEGALVDALRRGAIAGAALDVFEEEPLPASSPLWSLPNVVVTPHAAGVTPRYFERGLELFMENLGRYLGGRPLRNVVDHALGYPRS